MHLIVATVALAMTGMGVVGIASPSRLLALVSRWQSRTGLKVASIVRLAFGIALLGVAPSSETPETIDVLGIIMTISGILLPFVGIAPFRSGMAWWSRQSVSFTRACLAIAAGVGIFILWSAAARANDMHSVRAAAGSPIGHSVFWRGEGAPGSNV